MTLSRNITFSYLLGWRVRLRGCVLCQHGWTFSGGTRDTRQPNTAFTTTHSTGRTTQHSELTVYNILERDSHRKMSSSSQKTLHLIGVGVHHSIAPVMHNYICERLEKPYTFYATEAQTIEDAVALLKRSDFGGAVVTMPFKQSIVEHLDEADDLVATIGACNNVYTSLDGRLIGTNTDWRGVLGCLTAADERGVGKPAMIFGAGGASRAAVYALSAHLKSPVIYVVNRDEQEVKDLERDTTTMRSASGTRIEHITSLQQAESLDTPYYIVGTVPDFPPQSDAEKTAFKIFDYFMASATTPGVFLDMCFKPVETRKIMLAKKHGWTTVAGTEIIGHQIYEQYRVWFKPGTDEVVVNESLARDAWEVLRREAGSSPGINFRVDAVDFA
jgi:quinate dehydrogenase